MKEDILEQLVDDYLQANGYFTRHNVKFKPLTTADGFVANDDRVDSDVDVVGINPKVEGPKRVLVVSCKSWQGGFDPTYWISCIEHNKIISGRPAWKAFRELVMKKWADALIAKTRELTGTQSFTYVTAVTKLTGPESKWVEHEMFSRNLCGNPIKILTLEQILEYLYKNIGTAVAPSEVGRLLQVMKACGWKPA
jgi:hypothetical protein